MDRQIQALVLVDEKKKKIILEMQNFINDEEMFDTAKFIVAALNIEQVDPKILGETIN